MKKVYHGHNQNAKLEKLLFAVCSSYFTEVLSFDI